MNNYFCGWYFKCQSEQEVFSIIPAIHIENGKRSCSIQVITLDGAWNVTLPYCSFYKKRKTKELEFRMGENYFSMKGISLNLHTQELQLEGNIEFGRAIKIGYDIMGPFRYIPYMQCRHSVFSMKHTVNGSFILNGKAYDFKNGIGYIEGDRGYSFPKQYVWTQCCCDNGSIMVSVADIPIARFHFTGIIGVVYWNGKQYRFATYLGAKVMKIKNGTVMIRQGNMILTVKQIEKKEQSLYAPVNGKMQRTIHESPACKAMYCLEKGGETIFMETSEMASFEYEYPF